MNVSHALHVGYAWGMYQHLDEIRDFATLIVRMQARRLLEIGAHRGGTTACFASLCPDLVVSVDLPDGLWGGIGVKGADARDRAMAKIAPHVRPIRGNSQDPLVMDAVLQASDSQLFDVLFIDGDHSLAGVTADWENYASRVRPGGVVAFHDILHCERHTRDRVDVPEFWDKLKSLGTFRTEEFVANQGWGGIGVVHV